MKDESEQDVHAVKKKPGWRLKDLKVQCRYTYTETERQRDRERELLTAVSMALLNYCERLISLSLISGADSGFLFPK